MANKITNTLVANITAQEDSTQNIPINRGTGNPSFDSVFAQMTEYVVLASGDNVIPLPAATCYQLYVRNNDPALIITIKMTAKGGALTTREQLYPGDQFILWQANTGANAGYTALTLNASAANALVEYFIGG
jgi:hypothetical protein